MRIVLLSHTGRTGPFRVGSHHLAREFVRLGHRVAHVSNPISVAHLRSWRDPEVRSRARLALPIRLTMIDGAAFTVPWTVFPLTPDPLRTPLTLGSTRRLQTVLRAGGHLPADLVLMDQPLLRYLLDWIPTRTLVYRPTDINTDPAALRAEAAVLERADGVVATSQVVADRLAAGGPSRPSVVIGNGVEFAQLSRGRRRWAEREGAVYVGALDRRFDWNSVVRLGTAHPGEVLDLYGPLPAAIPDLPSNVRLRGALDYSELPAVLAAHRVGLLPLNDDPTNDGRSPMKLFEYLAAGLTVLARATAPIASLSLADVHSYTRPADVADTFGRALAGPPTGDGLEAARAMDWGARAALVLEAAETFRPR